MSKPIWPYAHTHFGVYQPLIGWLSRRTKKRAEKKRRRQVRELAVWVAENASLDTLKLPPDVHSLVKLRRERTLVDAGRPLGTVEARLQEATSEAREAERARMMLLGNKVPGKGSLLRILDEIRRHASLATDAGPEDTSERELLRIVASPEYDRARHEAEDTLREILGQRHIEASFGAAEPEALFSAEELRTMQVLSSPPVEVLSPIGLLHFYRQYYFETGTVLGPPIGHVWLTPKGRVELFEVHTKRVVQERSIEQLAATTSRTEVSQQTTDELSQVIRQENSQNTRLGIAASASGGFGVFSASASANYDTTKNSVQANETAHRVTRQQSAKVSQEIRQEVKTVFKTTVETTDSQSRRHELTNPTDEILNVELRRKMRRVTVQTQRIDTQLCWQIFVDNPGRGLGIASLVHFGDIEDLATNIVPPSMPAVLRPIELKYIRTVDLNEGRQETLKPEGPPKYVMGKVTIISPTADWVKIHHRIESDGLSVTFWCSYVDGVGIGTSGHVTFKVDWIAPQDPAAEAKFQEEIESWTIENERDLRKGFVDVMRERTRLLGEVEKRPSDDLREEERSVVYHELIAQLLDPLPTNNKTPMPEHQASEILRSIFDVDRMLYFVAPDWWRPRRWWLSAQDITRGPQIIPVEQVAGLMPSEWEADWGGSSWERESYWVTEESQPAPFGASLGWILQLDGDTLRNAFLNAPWVKVVLPIRHGKYEEALTWLESHVEGMEGLDAKSSDEPQSKTLREKLRDMAKEIDKDWNGESNFLKAEKLFSSGFDPLLDGFRAPDPDAPPDPKADPFAPFDSWVEILPTDQTVAMPWKADD